MAQTQTQSLDKFDNNNWYYYYKKETFKLLYNVN